MRQVFKNVEPIRPGFDSGDAISIVYGADFWADMELATGRLVAQFRVAVPDDGALFVADTDDGSIVRSGERGIVIRVPAASTALFSDKHILFDLVRIDGDGQRPVPGRWQWPVVRTVTRNVG